MTAERDATRRWRTGPFRRAALIVIGVAAAGFAAALISLAWRSPGAEDAEEAEAVVASATAAKAGDAFASCTSCHKDFDKRLAAGERPGLTYRHAVHFEKGVSDCAACHPASTHEPDLVNKPTMGRCFMCHGTTEVAIAPGTCDTCHPPGFAKKPTTHELASWREPVGDQRAAHGVAAKDTAIECSTCHEQAFCTSCHGVSAMPHPKGWKDAPHVDAFFESEGQTCGRCHVRAPEARDSCDGCHHPQGPADQPWRAAHPTTVKAEGATTCFQCHEPATCARCHVRGEENFGADRAVMEEARRGAAPAPPTTVAPNPDDKAKTDRSTG